MFSKYRTTNKKMMTRSKTAANVAKAIAKAETENVAKAETENVAKAAKAIANEPKEEVVESKMDNDKTIVYPSMFDRWREPL